jgi:hypothetical protein
MRGIVISPPVKVSGDRFHLENSKLDDSLVRFWITYWDKLDLPTSFMVHIGDDDIELKDRGVLERTKLQRGQPGVAILSGQDGAFLKREKEAPGCWSLAMGEKTLQWEGSNLDPGVGYFIKLANLLPTPSVNVQIDEILTFKERHEAEREALFDAIDELFLSIVSAPDNNQPMADRLATKKLMQAVENQLNCSKSSNLLTWNWVSLTAHFNWPGAIMGAATELFTNFSGMGSMIFAASQAAALSGGPSVSLNLVSRDRTTPFAYIGDIGERLDWR